MTSRDASNRLQFLWNASHSLLSTVPSLSAFYMQQFNQFAGEKELNLAEAVKRKYCSYCGSIFLPGLNSQIRIEKNKRRDKKRKLVDDIVNNTNDGNKKVSSVQDSVEQLEELNESKQILHEKSPRGKRQIIYIHPRSTTSVSLSNNQKQTHARRQQYKNHVSYICNSCNRETRFAGCTKRVINQISSLSNAKELKEENTFNVTTPIIPQVSNFSNTSPSTNSFKPIQDKLSTYKTKNTKKKQKKMQLQQLLAKEKRKDSGKDDFNDSSDGLSLANFLSAL
ncbi:7793_t:CDS:2 [Funneliformis geosporum]|uniref:15244_t:CDS:1 n=1 Tax=Funneliformis geosporum TaxID=1117311 RepID=A0A9W4WT44_9GLOM|nr:15244_t:CDS:2 [Funneliformis geosporum]CAI2187711.1 7793_t:CDS:2 [Funneliformis geosporum]